MSTKTTNDLKESFGNKPLIIISEAELNELLNPLRIVYEQDTRLRDFIRILRIGNHFYLQEKTNKGEIIIRQFDNEADALKLVNERMEIYDKMWDGCGCKINYYE